MILSQSQTLITQILIYFSKVVTNFVMLGVLMPVLELYGGILVPNKFCGSFLVTQCLFQNAHMQTIVKLLYRIVD